MLARDTTVSIYTHNIGVEVLDAVVHDGARVALVRNPVDGSFQLYHSLSSDSSLEDDQGEWMINTLPGCVDHQEGQGTIEWNETKLLTA